MPQLPEMDLRRSQTVYAAKSRAAELRGGILNANGRLSPAVQDSLTMRGLLRIVGPLPLVLGLGAFRMSNSRVDRSLAGLKKGSGQLLDFALRLASAACG